MAPAFSNGSTASGFSRWGAGKVGGASFGGSTSKMEKKKERKGSNQSPSSYLPALLKDNFGLYTDTPFGLITENLSPCAPLLPAEADALGGVYGNSRNAEGEQQTMWWSTKCKCTIDTHAKDINSMLEAVVYKPFSFMRPLMLCLERENFLQSACRSLFNIALSADSPHAPFALLSNNLLVEQHFVLETYRVD